MSEHPFMKGVGLGMLAGAAVGMTMMKNEKAIKRRAKKTAQSVGHLVEDATDTFIQKMPH